MFDNGNPCEIAQFTSEKAIKLAEYLSCGYNGFVTFTECRLSETKDIVCFTVQPELSQRRSIDIRNIEPIAVHFDREDKAMPTVYAVREDFPRQVPHLNLERNGCPANLCLYSEAYRDIKPFWTVASFIERIREWLKKTAKGSLHEDDQPLEPLFFGYGQHIILLRSLYDNTDNGFSIKRLVLIEAGEAFHAIEANKLSKDYKLKNGKLPPIAFCIKLPEQEHGIVRHTPLNMQDTRQLMLKANFDLYNEFYQSIKSGSITIDDNALNSPFCIIGWFPKKRHSYLVPETTDVWVFIATKNNVGKVLEDIGVYGSYSETQNLNGTTVTSLLIGGRDTSKNGENTDIIILNPTFTLSSDLVAKLNGYEQNFPCKLLAIGAGSIGSHIVLNGVKSGFGSWILVDDDIILPHNLARHALDGTYLGWPKVEALKVAANEIVSDKPILETFKSDFIQPQEDISGKIAEHLGNADIILDMSASVSVARHITHDTVSNARRISIFLSPSGKDLVILAEDIGRKTRLDLLEILYYREIMRRDDLKEHLAITSSKTRYANSCRDLSSNISYDHVALYGAIGNRNLRQIASNNAACAKIYRTDGDLQTSIISLPIEEFFSIKFDCWEVFIFESVTKDLFASRANKLPRETGGVLLGAFNLQHKIIYIVDIISDIEDSMEYPDAFIRGYKRLSDKINLIQDVTAGNITYCGEWHSHPNHAKCIPSNDDQNVMQWINDHMSVEGLPAIMLIVGDNDQLCVCINNEIKVMEHTNVRE